MKESDLYGPIWRGANAEGWSLFRIADGSVGKKPADIAGCTSHGVAVLVEVKLIRHRPAAWPPERPCLPAYELHQLAWLRRYVEARALALAYELDTATGERRMFMLGDPRQLDPRHCYSMAPPVVAPVQTDGDGTVRGWAHLEQAHREWASLRRALRDPLNTPP